MLLLIAVRPKRFQVNDANVQNKQLKIKLQMEKVTKTNLGIHMSSQDVDSCLSIRQRHKMKAK